MRLIGTIQSELNARRFSAYLTQQGIENRCEGAQIWVADEDRLSDATEELKRFCENPMDVRYNAAPVKDMGEGEEGEEEPQLEKRSKSPLTILLLALCVFVYMLNFLQEQQISHGEEQKPEVLILTPVQEALLYDLPPESPQAPYWHGLYNLMVLKLQGGDISGYEGPLFTLIRKGEIWRIFSPAILHLSFLHILFNMVWLWVLGRPIEARIGFFRLLVFTLVVAAVTNTAQYLMGGPLFLGFSGVVMGWAGFIWMREKIAPWEGYPLQRSTIYFLALFIFGMLALQIVSFLLTAFTPLAFPITIANTAHIVGFILGALFGRLPWLAWRVR